MNKGIGTNEWMTNYVENKWSFQCMYTMYKFYYAACINLITNCMWIRRIRYHINYSNEIVSNKSLQLSIACWCHYLYQLLLLVMGVWQVLASLITLCLNVDHPTGGFLTVGDGVLSMEGLELVPFTSVNPSSQSEELHQAMCLIAFVTKFTIPA